MNVKKIFLSILISITLIFSVNFINVSAQNADTLVIHYKRLDGNESDWSLWLWPVGVEQTVSDYFTGTDAYGVTATIDIDGKYGDISSLGILIKDDDWNKDIEEDRFIDLTQPVDGVVHAYFLQGTEYISYVSTDQVGCDQDNPSPYLCAQSVPTGLVDVYFDADLSLHFVSTESVTASNITVYEDGVLVPYTGFVSGETGVLDITGGVDVSKIYTIEIDYGTEITSRMIRINVDYDTTLFSQAYNYTGLLGPEYSMTETTFRVWAPISSAAEVNLYTAGHTTAVREDGADSPYSVVSMDYIGKGVWEAVVSGDLHGVYYTFNVVNSASKVKDIQDPYGMTFGLNGARAMVIDMDRVNPDGWDTDEGINGYQSANDAIIYELHVRDLTSQNAWGGTPEYKGLYMGFTETGTSYTNPLNDITVSTGLDHLIELGITHVHLLPTYDQDWNDERDFQFNWGYNPQNYNSPEGGYSTDPYDGSVRVNEYKQMVMALHDNGLNVINDVVYNHTGPGGYYSFNRIVPNYFYRFNADGSYSNGSGVGNETASERFMVNKFIVDSVAYWAEEYHIDGFRFDLMAIHDYETMNDLAEVAEAIDPDIFVYGEPWGGGTIALDYNLQAGKNNLYRMPLISAFNDQFRNALKGSPDGNDSGYITNGQNIFDIMKGIEGSINWGMGNTSTQSINYVTAHDNKTLFDKLIYVHGKSSYVYDDEIDYEARLANSIILFSQGVPFLHAGVDFLRTKGGDHNSYESSDSVNQLNWARKSNNTESFEYYKGIIEIRKEYESFRMSTRSDIETYLEFLNPDGYGLIGYNLTKNDENILVYHNGGAFANDVILPTGAWKLISDRDQAGLDGIGTYATRYPIEEAETLVFIEGNPLDIEPSPLHKPEITNSISLIYEGASFRLNSTQDIGAYQIDGGAWVETDGENSFVYIPNLVVGEYEIRIKDISGGISDPFVLTVILNPNISCEVDPNQDKCEVDPPVCETGYELVGDECTLIVDPDPIVCEEGYVLVNDECELVSVENNSNVVLIFIFSGVAIALSGVLFFFRRKLF